MDKKDRGYERAAPYYDIFDQKSNIPFFKSFTKSGMDILDLGAGTGRIAIPLAEYGCNVWCVEPSPAMMREFEKKLDATPKLNDKIHMKLTDSLHFQFDKKMDLAILSGTFDHFMDNSERIQALKNVHFHLKKNGILIFDVYLGLMTERPLSPAGKRIIGNNEYRRKVGSHVRDDGKVDVTLVYETWRSGKLINQITQYSQASTITYDTVIDCLSKAKFQVIDQFSSFNKESYRLGSELLIIIARSE